MTRSAVEVDLIGVPYSSAARSGGIANAIGVLRAAGLAERLDALGGVRDVGDLELAEGSGVRGSSGLLNERGLGRLVSATREVAARSLGQGRLPMLVGGDCPVVLGALAAGRDRHGDAGLLHVDGHEDAWPPHLSATGEASDSEITIALGHVGGLREPLDEPLLAPEALAMLGPRDRRELEAEGAQSVAGTIALFLDDEAVRAGGAENSARRATTVLRRASPRFWLHVDLDVLRTDDFPAADYLQPGGLAWRELLAVGRHALAEPGCLGCSVVIYNPDLDPQRGSAARIVRFVAELVIAASARHPGVSAAGDMAREDR